MRSVRVGPLTEEQRIALADLLGLDRLPPEVVTVPVAKLDQVLTEAAGIDLRQAVARFVGPIGDRAADRAAAGAERDAFWARVERHPVVAAQPALLAWVEATRRAGLVDGSVERTSQLVERALRVLAELPAAGVPLPVLAERVLHDPHALDDGTRCAGLVQRALAEVYELPVPVDAAARRRLWELAGVADDALSSVVLVAGLRPPAPDVVGTVLRVCADAGHAAALTLAQVRAAAWSVGLPEVVWVVENPSVLALALARFGTGCPPLVCTSGWPSSAGILMLRQLAAAGCELRYHGDFDGEGIRIAALLLSRTGARPWRMTTADYLTGLARQPSGLGVGRVTEAPWDAGLAAALRERDVTVSEERVVDLLLDDLAAHHSCG
ncbi:uncharacterized protein (TIGR02679 family) [Crossiella equi]|uniref:Uncharacterized protein (TIGR02679 family) n=1 Tax=Crossiella equi TaxID=130796 RepID=A0ABS5A7C1_9PSEU|nr:TIGR02679 family protein [Crossiella equi]MBP2472504.1 uncharacterized protein (TIGR02679 family) [Crossiella equi]